MKTIPLLVACLIPLLLTSCAKMWMKDHGFRKTPAVEINGAQVNSGVKPMGGKGGLAFSAMIVAAGTGTLDGPFRWRVEAEGEEGIHEWIRVNQARVSTSTTKRDEPFPRAYLGKKAEFVPIPGEKGETFAKFQLPGKLSVYPRTDGTVRIHLNVSVHAKGHTVTKWIRFELQPETKWKTETLWIPVEIVKSFRGDPRGWKW